MALREYSEMEKFSVIRYRRLKRNLDLGNGLRLGWIGQPSTGLLETLTREYKYKFSLPACGY